MPFTTKSPEVQFKVNFAQELSQIFMHKSEFKTKDEVRDALASIVVQQYNKYFETVTLNLRLELVDGKIALKEPLTEKILDQNGLQKLVDLGIISAQQAWELGAIQSKVSEWLESISGSIDEDSEKIHKFLEQNTSEILIKKEIENLTKEYSAKKAALLTSFLMLLLALASIAAMIALVCTGVLPLGVAIGVIGTAALFAVSEVGNIPGYFRDFKAAYISYRDFTNLSDDEKKGKLMNLSTSNEFKKFLKENTVYIGLNTDLDKQLDNAFEALKRTAELEKTNITLKRSNIIHKIESQNISNTSHEKAAMRFNSNVSKYLKEIYVDRKSLKSSANLKSEVESDLRKLYVNAHNTYFRDIGFPEFSLEISNLNTIVLKYKGDKGITDIGNIISDLEANKYIDASKAKMLSEAISSFSKDIVDTEAMLSDEAEKITGYINEGMKDRNLSETAAKFQDAKKNFMISSLKVTLSVALIIGIIICSVYGLIPAAAVAGIVSGVTGFAARELDGLVSNKRGFEEVKNKFLGMSKTSEISDDVTGVLKAIEYKPGNEMDKKFLNFVNILNDIVTTKAKPQHSV